MEACIERAYAAWELGGAGDKRIARVARLVEQAHSAIRTTPAHDLERAFGECAMVMWAGLPRSVKSRRDPAVIAQVVRRLRRSQTPPGGRGRCDRGHPGLVRRRARALGSGRKGSDSCRTRRLEGKSGTVDELRERIDAIDDDLLELLDKRARLVRDVFKKKKDNAQAVHDPEREQQIYERLERRLPKLRGAAFPVAGVRPVFREVISACLSLEEKLDVAYFGPQGTFTHMAAQSAFGMAVRYVEAATIPAVFDAVSQGATTYGVVPFENSTEGGVTFTLDSFLETDVMIRRQVVLDVCAVSRRAQRRPRAHRAGLLASPGDRSVPRVALQAPAARSGRRLALHQQRRA